MYRKHRSLAGSTFISLVLLFLCMHAQTQKRGESVCQLLLSSLCVSIPYFF